MRHKPPCTKPSPSTCLRRGGTASCRYCSDLECSATALHRPTRVEPAPTTTSACAAASDHGHPLNHQGFGWLGEAEGGYDTADRRSTHTPTVTPPRLRPLPPLLIMAVRPTATTPACAATVGSGRPSDHHSFGLCRCCSSRPPAQPPRHGPVLRLPIAAVSTSAGWGRAKAAASQQQTDRQANRPTTTTSACERLLMAAVNATTTASACDATADHGRLWDHRDFGLCCDCPQRPSVQPSRFA